MHNRPSAAPALKPRSNGQVMLDSDFHPGVASRIIYNNDPVIHWQDLLDPEAGEGGDDDDDGHPGDGGDGGDGGGAAVEGDGGPEDPEDEDGEESADEDDGSDDGAAPGGGGGGGGEAKKAGPKKAADAKKARSRSNSRGSSSSSSSDKPDQSGKKLAEKIKRDNLYFHWKRYPKKGDFYMITMPPYQTFFPELAKLRHRMEPAAPLRQITSCQSRCFWLWNTSSGAKHCSLMLEWHWAQRNRKALLRASTPFLPRRMWCASASHT